MGIALRPDRHHGVELTELVRGILEDNRLCAMSTVNRDGTAHVNTAFFCWDPDWRLFFTSSVGAIHSINVIERSSMAVTVYDSRQEWDDWKVGLQLFGSCTVARDAEGRLGAQLYKRRFPAYAKWRDTVGRAVVADDVAGFYVFVPDALKVLHEEVLGEENFVSVSLSRT